MTRPTHPNVGVTKGSQTGQQPGGRGRRSLGAVVSVVVLCIALWFLHHELSSLEPGAIFGQIRSIPLSALALAVIFAACSYLVLTGYDALGMRYLGHELDYRHTAQTSFMAFAVGNNVGIATLSGGSIRYRMYSMLGLSGVEIAKIVVFTSVTFALGTSLLLGAALLLMPAPETGVLHLSQAVLKILGAVLIALPFGYLLACSFVQGPISLGRWKFSLPVPLIGLAQIGVSVADLAYAAATLFILLAPELHIGFLPFLGIYLVAIAAGLLSSIPGGIGVFEAVLLLALPGVDRGVLLGTVVVYRLIYYVAPLFFALLLLVANEAAQHRQVLGSASRRVGQWFSAAAPQVIGLAVFLAGVVLLISGSTPAVESRLDIVEKAIPLSVLEFSHLAGSVLGVGLLVLARGLSRRLRSAYLAALTMLGAGMVASLVKGLDVEEALILLVISGFLWLSRDEFYRQGTLVSQKFTAGWVASIVLVLAVAFWVGLVSFRHVDYSGDLWWQFALHSDAPRMLRASMVAAMAAMSLALWKLLRSGPVPRVSETAEADMERVRAVVGRAGQSTANAALMGDKRFLWSADGQAFIMYQVSGNHWIALGDPVGPAAAWEELGWSFRELTDRHDGRPVFYQVSGESLAMYVDMGLTLAKLGEDGRVSLSEFSLEGSRRAEFRQALNKARKQGATFEIVPRAEVDAILADLRAVSDSWLADKAASEKGFSLGAFTEHYVSQFDCAIVRAGGAIVAFANLWPALAAGELSIDLMRHNQQAPKGIMDYLFTELMLWGKANGYAWFSLGMAPLSGLEQHDLAPLWHKLGHLIFSHGEAFYNFEGLRHYKEKFDPEWQPRYIACPGGVLGLPRALLDTSRLISGGVGGMLKN
jgi:phosphatidylglycerol lysyltransferase